MNTFNLLPQKEQAEVAREYKRRLFAFSFLMFASLFFVALIALIPSHFLLREKETMAAQTNAALSSAIAALGRDSTTETLKRAAAETGLLAQTIVSPPNHDLVSAVIRDKTANIDIAGIRVETGTAGRTATIIGEAGNRDALAAFADALNRDKYFSAVNVPVSNFAASANINFSLLLNVK